MLNFDLSLSLHDTYCLVTSLRKEKEEFMTSSKASLRNMFGFHAEGFFFPSFFFLSAVVCFQEIQSLHSHNLGDFKYYVIQPQLF